MSRNARAALVLASAFLSCMQAWAGPNIQSLSRRVGSTAGGAKVVITGKDFGPHASVSFGGVAVAAQDLVVLSDTKLQVMVPPHDPGMVDVVVSDGGTSTLKNSFEYRPAPTRYYFRADFEDGSFSPLYEWASGNGIKPEVSADVAHSGKHSGKCLVDGGTGSSAISYKWNHDGEPPNPALSSPTGLYQRFYVYFTPQAIANVTKPDCKMCQYKVLLNRTSLGGSAGGWFMSGFGYLFSSKPLNQWNNEQDMGVDPPAFFSTHLHVQPNTWYEIETWYKRDPESHTGVAKMWIDGQLVTTTPPGKNWGSDDPTVVQNSMYCIPYTQQAAGPVLVYVDDAAAADGFIEPAP